MSRDTQESKESWSQRAKGNQRKQRNEGGPSWYDKAVDSNYQEEVMQIPKDKVGLVIGRKGRTIKDVKERSGVKELFITDDLVHLRGTEEQRVNAKRIIDMILRGEDSPDQSSQWKKLDFIPEEYMGGIIGRSREHLNDIEQKTGATLKVFQRNNLCIKGSSESQKRAIREIKETVSTLMRQRQSASQRSVRCVHVDTIRLDPKQDLEFQLSAIVQPNGTKIYRLQPSQDIKEQELPRPPDFTGMEKLKDKFLTVLEKIHKEKEEERFVIDIWCHLGHAYITQVYEADEDEEYFTPKEIKDKLEEKNGWKSKFIGGLEKSEVECIEEDPEYRTAREEIRYDFTFFTPSCRYVRIKVWLTKKDVTQEGDEEASMSFSCAPFGVMTVSSHVLPDEQGDSSHTPCFYMCSQTQQRMKADIFMLSKGCDYRLFIKTCPICLVPRTPQDEEEDKILESYLMGMKIEGDQLVLPPVSERSDGFDLFYQRRSQRRIYEYETEEGHEFTLLVSKYQEKTVDPVETDVSGFDEIAIKTDIHLHCKEWDRLLEEGNWEPEHIVAKLPTFFQFLRHVQKSVTPQGAASDD